MNNVMIKICGITNQKDASMAVELGADALGFIFANSPRQITPQKARHIIRTVPSLVKKVGVFVDEVPDTINKIIAYCGLDLVQLHGNETPNLCQKLMPHTLKAFRIKNEASLQAIQIYQGKVKALLLDTYSRNKAGGTGNTFDWRIAAKIKNMGIPIILAGGLGPANIGDAIRTVRPCAVDVNSGVEERPGKKSHNLMKDLMEQVRRFNDRRGKTGVGTIS